MSAGAAATRCCSCTEVIAIDLPGFGKTPSLIGEVSIATLADSVEEFIRARGVLPRLLGNPVGRTVLLAQFSARPWALSPRTVLPDVQGLADAPATDAAIPPMGCAEGNHRVHPGRHRLIRRQSMRSPDASASRPLSIGSEARESPSPACAACRPRRRRAAYVEHGPAAGRRYLRRFPNCGHMPNQAA